MGVFCRRQPFCAVSVGVGAGGSEIPDTKYCVSFCRRHKNDKKVGIIFKKALFFLEKTVYNKLSGIASQHTLWRGGQGL
jgi:hypothetical protein